MQALPLIASLLIKDAVTSFVVTMLTAYFVGNYQQRKLAAKAGSATFDNEAAARTQMVRQPITPWRIVYGQARVSGPMTFIHTTENNQYLHILITLAGHEVEEIGDIYVNDYLLSLDAGGADTGRYAGTLGVDEVLFGDYDTSYTATVVLNGVSFQATDTAANLASALVTAISGDPGYGSAGYTVAVGATSNLLITATSTESAVTVSASSNGGTVTARTVTPHQLAHVVIKKGLGTTAGDAALNSYLQTWCPGKWTSAHRQSGRAKLYMRLRYNPDLFPGGIPTVSAVVKGKKVYDPRTGLTAWSDNPALCLRDYLTDQRRGLGAIDSEIDDDAVTAAANICEESVALAAGGTEERYTCNGTIDTDKAPKDGISRLLTAMAGTLGNVGGQWVMYAGAWRAPAVTLTDDDLDGPIRVVARLSRRETFNRVKGVFVSPTDSWQPTDFPPVTNATYLQEDNDEPIWRDIELPFTTSAATAQRIAKIELEKVRQQITVTLPCKLTAMTVQVGDVVGFTHSRFGWTAKAFEVVDFRFALRSENENPRLGLDLVLRETAEAVYDWNSGMESTVDPAPDTDLPDPFTVTAPSGLTVTESLYITRDGTAAKAKATPTWLASPSAFVTEYQVEYRLSDEAAWRVAGRTTALTFDVLDMAPGLYDFRVKAINTLAVASAWVTASKAIYGLSAAPADITGLTISVAGGLAILRWTQHPDLDVRLGGHILFRHSADEGATWQSSTSIGEAIPGSDTVAVLPLKPGKYLAKARDSSDLLSANAAGVFTKQASVLAFSNVGTVTESPTFPGTHSSTIAIDGLLKLDGVALIDSWGNIDDVADWDSEGGIVLSGTYDFSTVTDLGSVKRVRVTGNIGAQSVNVLDLIDSREENIDDWADFDGTTSAEADAQLWVRQTDDDPAGSPTWSDWQRLDSGEFEARGLDYQCRLSTDDPAYNIHVDTLTVTIDEVP